MVPQSSLRVVQSWAGKCKPGFEVTNLDSNIDGHRQRLCNFIDALEGDFSKEAVVLNWTEAFVNEDKRFLG